MLLSLRHTLRLLLVTFVLLGSAMALRAEGTKELKPSAAANVEGAFNPWDWGGNFASYTSETDTSARLNISIADYTRESIFFGFNTQNTSDDTWIRIKDASGTIVYGPFALGTAPNGTGYIASYAEAVAGPTELDPAGYEAFEFNPSANGDYYIELNFGDATTFNQQNIRYNYFDITVIDTVASEAKEGRVWASPMNP